MELKNILVTGAEGYIGAVLCKKLTDNGFNVVGIDSLFYKSSYLDENKSYKLLEKDIRTITEQDLKGIDCIIHLAALSNDAMSEIDPKLTVDINYKATTNLAKKAKEAGVKRFIFSSSCSVYGAGENDYVDENSRMNPQTTYATSKIKSEKILKKMSSGDFCVCILRNSTVYGYSPRFRNDLVVNNFVTHMLSFGEIEILSDGTPWRPLIDVRDLADIFIQFIKADTRKVNGEIFNIGFEENNFQVKDIANIIHTEFPDYKINFANKNGPDKRSYKVNFEKFLKTFPTIKQGWTLDKSVRDLVLNLKKEKFSKGDYECGKFTRIGMLKKLIEKNGLKLKE